MDSSIARLRFRPARAAIATLAWTGMSLGAHAQTFLGTPSAIPFSLPPDVAIERQLSPRPSAPQVASARGGAPAGDSVEAERAEAPERPQATVRLGFLRLPATASGWRIEGSGGELRWRVYAPAASEGQAARLRLRFSQDISVLPGSSPVIFSVNGRQVGSSSRPATSGLSVEFAVPAGVLRAGANEVAVAASHRHRVDCTLAATYELWTAVDPLASGLQLSAEAGRLSSLADLPALPRAADGSLRLRVLTPGPMPKDALARSIRLAEAATLAARSTFPIVEYDRLPSAESVNLLAEIAPRSAARTGETLLSSGIGLSVTEDGAPLLRIFGPTEASLDEAISALAGSGEAGPEPVELPGRRSLSDLGFLPPRTDGIRQAADFVLRLPDDFLPGNYEKAMVTIVGETRSDRGEVDGSIRLEANGRQAMVVPLPRRPGQFRQALYVPFGLLRPGENRLRLSTVLTGNADACEARNADTTLTFSEESEISLPRSARAGRFPDLARVGAGAAFGERGPLQLVLPQPDRASASAAATLAARLSAARGRLLAADVSLDGRPDRQGDTLIVAPIGAVRPALLELVGLDALRVARDWTGGAGDRTSGTALADPIVTGSLGPTGSCEARAPRSSPRAEVKAAAQPAAPSASLLLASAYERGRHMLGLDPVRRGAPVAGEDSLISQGLAPGGGRATLLAAIDGASLQRAAACLGRPDVWARLSGGTQFFESGTARLRTLEEPRAAYFSTGANSISNLRLVAGAWLSSRGFVMISIALLLAGIGAVSTFLLLGTVGRTSK